jgi:hypothetical protein
MGLVVAVAFVVLIVLVWCVVSCVVKLGEKEREKETKKGRNKGRNKESHTCISMQLYAHSTHTQYIAHRTSHMTLPIQADSHPLLPRPLYIL